MAWFMQFFDNYWDYGLTCPFTQSNILYSGFQNGTIRSLIILRYKHSGDQIFYSLSDQF